MKKLLKGFTLAEALITLAIIGIIASITLPALQTNILGTTLDTAQKKALNSLENGNRLMLQQYGARDLYTLCGDDYVKCLNTNKIISLTPAATGIKYVKEDLEDLFTSSAEIQGYEMKDGIVIYANGTGSAIIAKQDNGDSKYLGGAQYYGKYYKIYVDVNGTKKKPNMLNNDLFEYYVDYYGEVIPTNDKARMAQYTGLTEEEGAKAE